MDGFLFRSSLIQTGDDSLSPTGDYSKRDSLVLSVATSCKAKSPGCGKVQMHTDYKDYVLARGRKNAAKYLNLVNGVEDYIRGMGPDEFRDFIGEENDRDSLPDVLKPVVKLKPVVSKRSGKGVYAQLFLCDTGPGGGIVTVHAESPKYRFPRRYLPKKG